MRRLKMEKNMKSKIVVDSSANVYELPDVGFACVPLKILTDEQEYVDTAEVDAPALAEMMRTYKGRTSTSCPNISDRMAAYEGADEVYVVTITGTLSGAYNAALLAGEEYEQSRGRAGLCAGQPVYWCGVPAAGGAFGGADQGRQAL